MRFIFSVAIEIAIVLLFAGFFLGVYQTTGGAIIAGVVIYLLLSLTTLGKKINKAIFK